MLATTASVEIPPTQSGTSTPPQLVTDNRAGLGFGRRKSADPAPADQSATRPPDNFITVEYLLPVSGKRDEL